MSNQQLAPPDGLTALVASEIRALMGRLNINRAELSRRLGVEDSWVGKRLNGRTEISLSDLQRIAAVFGVKASDLLRLAERGEEPYGDVVQSLSTIPALAVTGTHPHPTHPIVTGAIRLPQQNGLGRTAISERRTAPTGR